MALNWGDGEYTWSDPQVAACLAVGVLLLTIFGFYGELNLLTYASWNS
jgi:hypothetical protein